jgi:hypothetical protein
MLKPSSGTDEGPALFTRELDRLQRALHAFVRTGWRTPQGVKLLQHGRTACMIQGRSGQPRRAHPHCEGVGSMAEGFVGREMISQLGIKVTNDPNSQWCVHAAFLLIASLYGESVARFALLKRRTMHDMVLGLCINRYEFG